MKVQYKSLPPHEQCNVRMAAATALSISSPPGLPSTAAERATKGPAAAGMDTVNANRRSSKRSNKGQCGATAGMEVAVQPSRAAARKV